RGCPWCAFVAIGGPNYFRGTAATTVVFVFDRTRLAALWAKVEQAPALPAYDRRLFRPAQPPLPRPLPTPTPADRGRNRAVAVGLVVGLVASLTVILALGSALSERFLWLGPPVVLVFAALGLAWRSQTPLARERRVRQ